MYSCSFFNLLIMTSQEWYVQLNKSSLARYLQVRMDIARSFTWVNEHFYIFLMENPTSFLTVFFYSVVIFYIAPCLSTPHHFIPCGLAIVKDTMQKPRVHPSNRQPLGPLNESAQCLLNIPFLVTLMV